MTNLDTRILRYFVGYVQNTKLKKENIYNMPETAKLENNAFEKLEEENS